jgi:hypothetical protein
LRDAQVFEKHPGGMREVFRFLAAKLGRKFFYGVVEVDVGVATVEKLDDLLAQRLVSTTTTAVGRGHGILWQHWIPE